MYGGVQNIQLFTKEQIIASVYMWEDNGKDIYQWKLWVYTSTIKVD